MNNIQEHKDYVTSQLEKAFGAEIEKAHKVGDQHPNGKWVWTEYKPGKFDWRPPKKNGVEQKKTEQGGGEEQGGKKSLDEHAADASTEALKKVAESPNAGKDLKAAAQKELENRGEKSGESTDKDGKEGEKPQVEKKVKIKAVEIPKEIGLNGSFYNWSVSDKETYTELAKYGDIVANSFKENFGEDIGDTPVNRQFDKRMDKLLSGHMDTFADTIVKNYVWAKLSGVNSKDLIPVTVGLYNQYNSDLRGYKIHPKDLKWDIKGDYKNDDKSTWKFNPLKDNAVEWAKQFSSSDKETKSATKVKPETVAKITEAMSQDSKFVDKVESLLLEHLGDDIEKKYGTKDFSDIFDQVGEDKYDETITKWISQLPSDAAEKLYNDTYKKQSQSKTQKVKPSLVSSVTEAMAENSRFADKVESLIRKHLGDELKEKYDSDDFADIYDKVGDENYDKTITDLIKKLPAEDVQKLYDSYAK